MVKALFHKNQRVFVATVGTWAIIERVIPQWVKGVEEPLRIHYDCGLGREFEAHELAPEQIVLSENDGRPDNWRVFRARNRWQSLEESAHHPVPGTHPLVITGDDARGGWRVPSAEYDSTPHRYEQQARMIASAPRLLAIARALVEFVDDCHDEAPLSLIEQAKEARSILNGIENVNFIGVQTPLDAAMAAKPALDAALALSGSASKMAAAALDVIDEPSSYLSPALRRRPAIR